MSDALTVEPGSLRWEPAAFLPGGRAPVAHRSAVAVDLPALPSVQPGTLWLVGFSDTEPELSPLASRALTTANVVIYDRSLEMTVARALPLGGYAEPAAPGDARWERALRFVRDGWSVAQLVDRAAFFGKHEISEIHRLTEGLIALWSPSRLFVSLFIGLGGQRYEKTEMEFGELDAILDLRTVEQHSSLTIIFDVATGGTPARFSVASANGLAG
jgi:hypothetical protein